MPVQNEMLRRHVDSEALSRKPFVLLKLGSADQAGPLVAIGGL